ncbi:MAG: hypothetical protein IT445_11200 [Phycisphaeraceae bacterium]|nr:hypothetical protein [Phycisphaeraceae bacterium]
MTEQIERAMINMEQVMRSILQHKAIAIGAILVVGFALAAPAHGHCDAVDGPVAKDLERAISERDVAVAMKWIAIEDEEEARQVFEQAMSVRAIGDEAESLADRHLLETFVRLHRKSEGEPYTGLKPAGQPLPMAVEAVDAALVRGSVDALIVDLQRAVERAVRNRFEHARTTAASAELSVESGRSAVHAYVELVHFTERLHELISADPPHAVSLDAQSAHH